MIEEYKKQLDEAHIRRTNTMHSIIGCEKAGGKWDKDHSVCILREIEPERYRAYGWTGPIHGAFFWWHVGTKEDDVFGGEIGGKEVSHCEIYPNMPCTDPHGVYHKEIKYNKQWLDEAFNQSCKVRLGMLRLFPVVPLTTLT